MSPIDPAQQGTQPSPLTQAAAYNCVVFLPAQPWAGA
jgi:hypothetical protein